MVEGPTSVSRCLSHLRVVHLDHREPHKEEEIHAQCRQMKIKAEKDSVREGSPVCRVGERHPFVSRGRCARSSSPWNITPEG